MCRPPADFLSNDLSFASRTGFPMLLEDAQVILMLAGPVQHVPIEPHRSSPMRHAGLEVRADRGVECLPFAILQRVRLAPGVQTRIVQNLVDVNIAYPRYDLLIQQQRLHLRPPGRESLAQVWRTELPTDRKS